MHHEEYDGGMNRIRLSIRAKEWVRLTRFNGPPSSMKCDNLSSPSNYKVPDRQSLIPRRGISTKCLLSFRHLLIWLLANLRFIHFILLFTRPTSYVFYMARCEQICRTNAYYLEETRKGESQPFSSLCIHGYTQM
jgi:hypothetical protein